MVKWWAAQLTSDQQLLKEGGNIPLVMIEGEQHSLLRINSY